MNGECHRAEDAAAYLSGELSLQDAANYREHLESCACCREAVAGMQGLFTRLRQVPAVPLEHDLAPAILARFREEEQRPLSVRFVAWRRRASIAALIAVCAGLTIVNYRQKAVVPEAAATSEARDETVAKALDWFCANQRPDGSWDAEKWGGHRRFDVALTALPALALLSVEAPTPAQQKAAAKAAGWLKARQDSTGSFGPEFQAAPYNSSIATLALLHAYQRERTPELKQSLDAALKNLTARQTAAGGWGYLYSPFADRSITEWHLEALEFARSLGWSELDASATRARSWLAVNSPERSEVNEPADSPSRVLAQTAKIGADGEPVDFYRAYFVTAALRRARDASSLQHLAALKTTLQQQQSTGGPESGSWPADDRWGRAGGRLYSTALASISLETMRSRRIAQQDSPEGRSRTF